jgi:hypothetical protein
MRIVARVLIATALAFSSGCAPTDWIDRTLVTEDVTGTWYGRTERELFFLELKQEGSRVTGSIESYLLSNILRDLSKAPWLAMCSASKTGEAGCKVS